MSTHIQLLLDYFVYIQMFIIEMEKMAKPMAKKNSINVMFQGFRNWNKNYESSIYFYIEHIAFLSVTSV